MELNFTGQSIQAGNAAQVSLYKSVQLSNPNLSRVISPLITAASLLIGVVARVANIVESIFKGLANIIVGNIKTGVDQLLKTPLKALEIPLLEIIEIAFGTIGLLIDPRETANVFEIGHNDFVEILDKAQRGNKDTLLQKLTHIMYR